MPSVTVTVVVGTDRRAASATVRAARTWLAPVAEVTERLVPIDLSAAPAPESVGRTTTVTDLFIRAGEAAADWALLLQPGERPEGRPEALPLDAAGVDAVGIGFDAPRSLVPDPTGWGNLRLFRRGLWADGPAPAREGPVEVPGVRLRRPGPPDDRRFRAWLLGVAESWDPLDLACALHHCGELDSGLVRLLRLHAGEPEARRRVMLDRLVVAAAMTARRPSPAKRAVDEWVELGGGTQSSLTWQAIVELSRDRPAAAYEAMTAARSRGGRDDDGPPLDPAMVAGLATGLAGTLKARQAEALRYREVVRTAADERRRRAAASLVHAWPGAGLDPAALFEDLTPEAIEAMGQALVDIPTADAELWLQTAEAYLDRARPNDRMVDRIMAAAAPLGPVAARPWSERLRLMGLARFCPLVLIATAEKDPVRRVVASAMLAEMGDTTSAPLAAVVGTVPTWAIGGLLGEVGRRVPGAVGEVARLAAVGGRP